MMWRDRDDLWFGLALSRPFEDRAAEGGAFVAFVVRAVSIQQAVVRLSDELEASGWILSSLEGLRRAVDYHAEDDAVQEEHERLALNAIERGVALGAFHVFPRDQQSAS